MSGDPSDGRKNRMGMLRDLAAKGIEAYQEISGQPSSEELKLIDELTSESSQERLMEFAHHPSPQVSAAVARNPWTSVVILDILARRPEGQVRQAVLEHPNLPTELLVRLSMDKDPNVRAASARHPSLPESLLRLMANNHREPVQVHLAVAENRAASEDMLLRLANARQTAVKVAVARHARATPAVLEVAARGNHEVLCELAQRQDLTESLALFLARQTSTEAPRLLAENTFTPPVALAELAQSPAWLVRIAVAANPKTPSDVLCTLARDREVYVRQALLRNSELPGAALQCLASDEQTDIAVAAQVHPKFLMWKEEASRLHAEVAAESKRHHRDEEAVFQARWREETEGEVARLERAMSAESAALRQELNARLDVELEELRRQHATRLAEHRVALRAEADRRLLQLRGLIKQEVDQRRQELQAALARQYAQELEHARLKHDAAMTEAISQEQVQADEAWLIESQQRSKEAEVELQHQLRQLQGQHAQGLKQLLEERARQREREIDAKRRALEHQHQLSELVLVLQAVLARKQAEALEHQHQLSELVLVLQAVLARKQAKALEQMHQELDAAIAETVHQESVRDDEARAAERRRLEREAELQREAVASQLREQHARALAQVREERGLQHQLHLEVQRAELQRHQQLRLLKLQRRAELDLKEARRKLEAELEEHQQAELRQLQVDHQVALQAMQRELEQSAAQRRLELLEELNRQRERVEAETLQQLVTIEAELRTEYEGQRVTWLAQLAHDHETNRQAQLGVIRQDGQRTFAVQAEKLQQAHVHRLADLATVESSHPLEQGLMRLLGRPLRLALPEASEDICALIELIVRERQVPQVDVDRYLERTGGGRAARRGFERYVDDLANSGLPFIVRDLSEEAPMWRFDPHILEGG